MMETIGNSRNDLCCIRSFKKKVDLVEKKTLKEIIKEEILKNEVQIW
jgi:predicted nucleotidyltransferase